MDNQELYSKQPIDTIEKINWFGFFANLIISIIVLIILIEGLALLVEFTQLMNFITLYILVGIISLIIGFISVFIFYNISKSNSKYFIIGSCITSYLPAILISIFFKVQEKTIETLSNIDSSAGFAGMGAMTNLFSSEIPNGLIVGFVLLILFNISTIIFYNKIENKNPKYFVLYLVLLVLFLILYFTIPSFVI